MNKKILLLWMAIMAFNQIFSQEMTDSLRKNSINIYIDCGYCDLAHIKKEINFVNYVRETQDAHVYILITYQLTGSGGIEFSFLFKGQKEFKGENDTLKLITEKNSTDSERRNMQIHTLKLGLLKYMAQTPLAGYLQVDYKKPEQTTEFKDKWNQWLFNLSMNTYLNGEKLYKTTYLWSNFSISKIAEKFKITNRFSVNYESNKFGEGEDEYISEQYSYAFSHLSVFSLNQHWSVGEFVNYRSSKYSNYKNSYSFSPAIEYNIFPFSESTRKLLIFNYRISTKFNEYIDTTIYNKKSELLFQQNLGISFTIKEKWGSIYTSLVGSHYFHDLRLNNLSLYSRLNYRIFKGVSLNFSIGASLIHDQLNLPKETVGTDDLLLRQRELETSYQYWGSFGININFGSIFNNTVNDRFGSESGSTMIIIN